jgi:glutathione synthase/RimK-type ligase-like ATP-grasp enzyme
MILITIKFVYRFVYLFRKTNFKGLSLHEQENVVWVYIFGRSFFFSDELVNTCAIINALSTRGIKFNIKTGRKIGKAHNKKVFFTYSRKYDAYNFSGYPATIKFICEQLEHQGCKVSPSSYEVEFWENKAFMHRKFEELNISTPRTKIYSNPSQLLEDTISFPCLIKEEHSFSSYGLHKIESKETLRKVINDEFFTRNKNIILQELLNMRRDLRVILVGNKIVLHYWRINKGKDWKPTSTSHGSDVDFVSFPEQWRSFIIDQFTRLGLRTGAFDIAWQNDDLSKFPQILEVSPYYQPNPPVDLSTMSISYGQYKQKFLWKDGYDKKFVDVVFRIIQEQINQI